MQEENFRVTSKRGGWGEFRAPGDGYRITLVLPMGSLPSSITRTFSTPLANTGTAISISFWSQYPSSLSPKLSHQPMR